MGYTSRFYIECVKYAWRGSIERANAFGALFGGLLLLFILQYVPGLKELRDIEVPTTTIGTILFNLEAGVVSMVLVWLVFFLGRLCWAPAHLYAEARRKIDVLARLYAEAQRKIDLLAKPQEVANSNLTFATNTTHNHFHVSPNATVNVILQSDGTRLNK